jgi:hypothetical protein
MPFTPIPSLGLNPEINTSKAHTANVYKFQKNPKIKACRPEKSDLKADATQ